MLTILHASDLQCGRPFVPRAADAFVRIARETAPDVVVVSGDLTQRAKRREFRVANELMARLPQVPVVVTPGNHDVPLYRFWERAFSPHRNWTQLISAELDSSLTIPGATFVALDSSAPYRAVIGGRLRPRQIAFARREFAQSHARNVRVLVVHHHFVPMPDRKGGRPLPKAAEHVGAFEAMGVDLVLGGHVHQTHVTTSAALSPRRDAPGLPLVSSGTTTSRRGRGMEEGLNSFNLIGVGSSEIRVVPHVLARRAEAFEPRDPIVLPRRHVPGESSVPAGGIAS